MEYLWIISGNSLDINILLKIFIMYLEKEFPFKNLERIFRNYSGEFLERDFWKDVDH